MLERPKVQPVCRTRASSCPLRSAASAPPHSLPSDTGWCPLPMLLAWCFAMSAARSSSSGRSSAPTATSMLGVVNGRCSTASAGARSCAWRRSATLILIHSLAAACWLAPLHRDLDPLERAVAGALGPDAQGALLRQRRQIQGGLEVAPGRAPVVGDDGLSRRRVFPLSSSRTMVFEASKLRE